MDADAESLRVIGKYVGTVQLSIPVLAEVAQLPADLAVALGIVVHDLEAEFMEQCLAKLPGLSFQDRICLALASREGWTCVTNDKRLRRACQSEGVGVLWGLELLLLAVQAKGLEASAAIVIAEWMAGANPYLARVLQDFVDKLTALPR